MQSHVLPDAPISESEFPFRAFARVCAQIIVILAAASRGVAAAENWPQWRGPKNDGVSAEKNLPIEWNREKNIAWRLALPGSAGSTPAVWDDRIFLTSADKSDLLLLCVGTDGKERWRRKLATGNRDVGLGTPEGNMASPSPSHQRD